jgi:hypothetical protein
MPGTGWTKMLLILAVKRLILKVLQGRKRLWKQGEKKAISCRPSSGRSQFEKYPPLALKKPADSCQLTADSRLT